MRGIYRYGGLALIAAAFLAGAQEQSPPAATAYEFILEPVATGYSAYISPAGRNMEFAFRKEPAYAGDNVVRSALIISQNPLQYIGVAYDVVGEMLYVDQNQNLDLTDDGPGVAASEPGWFPETPITLVHDGVPVSYTLSIRFYGTYMIARVQSGWKAEIEIAGKRCHVGIADDLDGVFNSSDPFRFDHEGHREVRLAQGDEDTLSLPQWLYFEGQAYDVDCAFRVMLDKTVVVLTLTARADDLMRVSFEGRDVSRLMLRGENNTLGLLDWPRSEMHIPEGNYGISRVDLLDSFYARRWRDTFDIGENDHIRTGGPLRQQVNVRRSGGRLNLSYALVGVDGLDYTADSWYRNPVDFSVYRGDRKLFSDQFEYG